MFCIHSKPIEKQSNCMTPARVETRPASHFAPHNPVVASFLQYKDMENNDNLRDFHQTDPPTLDSLEEDEEAEQEQQLQPHDWLSHPVSDLDTLPNYLDTGISHPFQFEPAYPNISFGSELPREASAAMIMRHTTRTSDIDDDDSDTQRKLDAKAGIAVQYPLSPHHGHARMNFPAHSFDDDPAGMHNMGSHDTRTDFLLPDTGHLMESTIAPREDISYLAANPASFSDSMAEHARASYDNSYMARSSSPFRGPRYHNSYHRHYREPDTGGDHRYPSYYAQVGVSHPMNNRLGERHHVLYAAHRRQYSASMLYYHHPYQEESSWDRKPSPIPRNDPRTTAPESQPDFELPAMGGSKVASRPLGYTDTAPVATGESYSRAKAPSTGPIRKSTRTKKRPTTTASPEKPRSRVARSAKKAPPTSSPRSGADGTSSKGNTSDTPSPDTSQLFHSDMTTRSHNAMKTWCERLGELEEYMRQHGHGK
jgi:hypothetical protein